MPKARSPTPSPPSTKTPSVGPTVDLAAYANVPTGPTGAPAPSRAAKAAAPNRPQRPRVSWEHLVGKDGLLLVDAFPGTDETFGEYVAGVVRLPANPATRAPSVDVLVITNRQTRAGKTLGSKVDANAFAYDAAGAFVPVPIRVGARKPTQHADGTPVGPNEHPMILLSFGGQ